MDLDGSCIQSLFNTKIGYTYEDIIILPGYINHPTSNINLKTQVLFLLCQTAIQVIMLYLA